MTGLERNADVVPLATYAPLLAHVDAWQWNPDLIWFDNLRMMRTPNYYVQQLYGMNPGNDVLPLRMDGKPVAGQEQLYATAALDAATGEVILKIVNASAAPAVGADRVRGAKETADRVGHLHLSAERRSAGCEYAGPRTDRAAHPPRGGR